MLLLCVCSATATALTDESEVVVMSTINSYRSLFVSANASCLFATYLTAGINVIYVISILSSLLKHKFNVYKCLNDLQSLGS